MSNPLRRLCHAYLRLRHSYGHGVHSPFAFSLIENVIRPGDYHFYGYHDIDRTYYRSSPSTESQRSLARFLLRLMVFLGSKTLYHSGELPEVVATSVKCAGAVTSSTGTSVIPQHLGFPLLLMQGDEVDPMALRNYLGGGSAVLAIMPGKEIKNLLTQEMECGVAFYDNRAVLAVPRQETAFVSYECQLRF